MDLSKGYLRLFRKFEDWEWYTKPNTKAVFIHCLIKANNEDKQWQGIVIKRGQFVTSLEKIAIANGLTMRQTRTALDDLQKTNEIDKQTTNRYSIITVKNYNLYQTNDKQKTHANDKQTTSKTTSKRQQRINNSNTSYINISLSIKERENLKKYLLAKKKNIQDVDAYIRKLLDNGDIQIILERAQKWQENQEKKKERSIQNEVEEQDITPEEQEKIKEIQQKIRKGMKK